MRVALWGPDHVELGKVAVEAAGPAAAVALTRGRHPKRYHYVDPNEDCVAAVAGPRATLLVCADGHNGATASVRAVEVILEELGEDPPPTFDDRDWLRVFARANDEILRVAGADGAHPSRTVLVAAVSDGQELSWAAAGDAALVVAAPGERRGRQLNREAMRFLGYPMRPRALRDVVGRGRQRLEPGEWVVLVTDGLSEFTRPLRPADVVPRALARAAGAPPADAARALIDWAGDAGAGDNVGVALAAPWG